MEQLSFSTRKRERTSKGDNKRLRRQGSVPAIIYGGDAQPTTVAVDEHELELVLRGARRTNAIFNLRVDAGAEAHTIIRDIQRHPVTDRLVHVDFQRISLDQELVVEVPVHAIGGDPVGVRAGGILEHITRTIAVRCRPLDMPKSIEVDLSNLGLNQSFHIHDLKLAESIKVVDDPDTTLFTVLAPAAAAAEAEAPAEEAVAEPEVIGEKKKEEEETTE
jgi:large subunit ribosomal protein L25